MKKENIIIYISAAALVLSSVALSSYTKDQAYPPKIKTESATEFAAATKVDYSESERTIAVNVRTNAPDGTVIKVSAQHPYTSDAMKEYKVVKNGKVSSVFTVPEGLPSFLIPVEITLDMAENQYFEKAVELYGENGEKITGENVKEKDGNFTSTIVAEKIPFPNEKVYKNDLFTSYIYYNIVEPYNTIFDSINPSESGIWNEFHVNLTADASSEESWSTMTDEILTGFCEMFEGLVREASLIPPEENVTIYFHHANGDILAQKN